MVHTLELHRDMYWKGPLGGPAAHPLTPIAAAAYLGLDAKTVRRFRLRLNARNRAQKPLVLQL